MALIPRFLFTLTNQRFFLLGKVSNDLSIHFISFLEVPIATTDHSGNGNLFCCDPTSHPELVRVLPWNRMPLTWLTWRAVMKEQFTESRVELKQPTRSWCAQRQTTKRNYHKDSGRRVFKEHNESIGGGKQRQWWWRGADIVWIMTYNRERGAKKKWYSHPLSSHHTIFSKRAGRCLVLSKTSMRHLVHKTCCS